MNPSGFLQNRPRLSLPKLLASLLFVVFSFAISVSVLAAPRTASVTRNEWTDAQKWVIPSTTLQISYAPVIFERDRDFFAELFARLPVEFPEYKLNTLGRHPHETWLYMDNMALDDVREVALLMKKMTPEVLAKYRLNRRVKLYDLSHVEVFKMGHFGAIRPTIEGREYLADVWRMIADLAPRLIQKHLQKLGITELNEDNAHFSLIQHGEKAGLVLSAAQEKAMLAKLQRVVDESAQKVIANGGPKEIYFSLMDNPIEFVSSPISIHAPPMAMLAYMLNHDGTVAMSDVLRWQTQDDDEMPFVVEIDVEKWLAGDPTPFEEGEREGRILKKRWRQFDTMPAEQFRAQLSSRVRRIWDAMSKGISPTQMPAAVPTADERRKNQFFVTNRMHTNLWPEKVLGTLEMVRGVGLKSRGSTLLGTSIYASSGRKEVHNPGDSDLAIQSIIEVPDSIDDFEQVKAFAAQAFLQDVLHQLLEKMDRGIIANLEMRMSSDFMMDIPGAHNLRGRENSPFLSADDLRRGYFIDKSGRRWPVLELLKHWDFTKGKIDYFTKEGREELSLQFLCGVFWKGTVIYLHQDALKGVPPLMRTMIADGADAFALAASLSRPAAYFSVQKGPMLPRAFFDVIASTKVKGAPINREPWWNPKFVKKVYNAMILLGAGPLNLDDIFWKELREILSVEGKWKNGYTIEEFVNHVVNAINIPHIKLANSLRRDLNDFSEFNERQNVFTLRQWWERVRETDRYLGKLQELIAAGEFSVTAEFQASLNAFARVFAEARAQTKVDDAIAYLREPSRYDVIHGFELALLKLEGQFVFGRDTTKGLTDVDKDLIRAFVGYAPHIYWRYLRTRGLESRDSLRWVLIYLGMEPTNENFDRMDYVSQHYQTMTRAELAHYQELLYASASGKARPVPPAVSPCERTLLPGKPPAPGGGGK